jgi:hypothetical protein
MQTFFATQSADKWGSDRVGQNAVGVILETWMKRCRLGSNRVRVIHRLVRAAEQTVHVPRLKAQCTSATTLMAVSELTGSTVGGVSKRPPTPGQASYPF